MMDRSTRFARSKCDRCGKVTKAEQNGESDLYTLPHEWPLPLSDLGDFCEPCIGKHNAADWLVWVEGRCPRMCARYDMARVRVECDLTDRLDEALAARQAASSGVGE